MPPPTGYSGPVISQTAQRVLLNMEGESFFDDLGVLGGGEWTIGRFGVVPNPVSVSGKGPVLKIRQLDNGQFMPMEADGDVADLYRRVHGSLPDSFDTTQSMAYKAVWRVK